MPQKLGMIGFVTHPKMGHLVERPSPAMSQNTIALAAYSVQLDGHDVRSRDDFLKLAKGWVESGMGTQFDGVNVTLTDQADPRYRVLNANVSPAHLQDDWCVSYEYRGEERKNPVSPNVVFEQEDFGQLCLEPKFKKYMVHMSLSERFGKGKRLSPNLLEKIFIADAKPFFESLKFVE